MYDKKAFEFKDTKYRSSILTNGLGKSGERALLYATGMDEEDIKKYLGVHMLAAIPTEKRK